MFSKKSKRSLDRDKNYLTTRKRRWIDLQVRVGSDDDDECDDAYVEDIAGLPCTEAVPEDLVHGHVNNSVLEDAISSGDEGDISETGAISLDDDDDDDTGDLPVPVVDDLAFRHLAPDEEPDEDGASNFPSRRRGDECHDIDDLIDAINIERGRSVMGKEAFKGLWSLLHRNRDILSGAIASDSLPTAYEINKRLEKFLPPIYMDVAAFTREGEEKYWSGVQVFPKKEILSNGYQVHYTLTYVHVQDVIQFAQKLHRSPLQLKCDLSVDGIPESKSGGVSLDIVTMRFIDCSNVYPLAIMKPGKTAVRVKESIVLDRPVQEIAQAGVEVRAWVADAPKRASIKGSLSHAGTYPCDVCFAPWHYVRWPARWMPSSSMGAPKRTRAAVEQILRKIERQPQRQYKDWPQSVVKGVRSRSMLDRIPGFDSTVGVPIDVMHALDLGVTKKMAGMSVQVKGVPNATAIARRLDPFDLDEALSGIRVPSEFSRRVREFDHAHYKAEEWRNFTCCLFPAFIGKLPSSVRHIWLLSVYLFRALQIPNAEYYSISEDLQVIGEKWYKGYEKSFGEKKCSYNTHLVHHLVATRNHFNVPLTELSALRFESHYGLLQRYYYKGTCSPGKQAISGGFRYYLSAHKCKKTLTLSPRKPTDCRDDTILWVFPGYLLKQLSYDTDTKVVTGFKLVVDRGCHLLPELDYNDVLVFRLGKQVKKVDRESLQVHADDVLGKGVVVEDIVSVMTTNMLVC